MGLPILINVTRNNPDRLAIHRPTQSVALRLSAQVIRDCVKLLIKTSHPSCYGRQRTDVQVLDVNSLRSTRGNIIPGSSPVALCVWEVCLGVVLLWGFYLFLL